MREHMQESVLTYSRLGEEGSRADSREVGTSCVPRRSPRRAQAGRTRGPRGWQTHRRHNQPRRLQRPRRSSHRRVSLPATPGGKKDGGSTRCSPGITAPAACKRRVTQPPPPPRTSSCLKRCLSSVSFTPRFPYDSQHFALTLCDYACHPCQMSKKILL